MKLPTLALLVTLVAAAGQPSLGAPGTTLAGRVVLVDHGKQVAMTADVPAFVYLEQISPRREPPAVLPAREIRQVNRQFTPHVLVVPAGTAVAFPNYDREEHNVFSPSEIDVFDLLRYTTDKKGKQHVFEGAGEIEIYCDIHKDMWARVKVVKSDYITEVKHGSFSFTGVPPGKYKVHAWYRGSPETVEAVTLVEGATKTTRELHLQVDPLPSHLRKDGTAYPVDYEHR